MSADDLKKTPTIRVALPAIRERFEQRVLLFRLVIGGLVLGSLALAWFSVIRVLLPQQSRNREMRLKVSQLSAEVEALQRNCSAAETTRIHTRSQQARARLFADQDAVEHWLANLKTASALLTLNAKAEFGAALPKTIGGRPMAILPATIAVNLKTVTDEVASVPPYQRLLRFVQDLEARDKRADLTQLSVTGDTHSLINASVVFNLWAHAEAAR